MTAEINSDKTYYALQVRVIFPPTAWSDKDTALSLFQSIYNSLRGTECVPTGMCAMYPDHDGAFSVFVELPDAFRDKPEEPAVQKVKDVVFEHIMFPFIQSRFVELAMKVNWFHCFHDEEGHHFHTNFEESQITKPLTVN